MATRQYVGARYVPQFATPIEWSSQSSYEALTIVNYNNASYTSKKPVPAGTLPTNAEYWALTGNYNGQVEQYRQEVENVTNNVDSILKEMNAVHNYLENKRILIIGDSISDENINWNPNISEVWVKSFRPVCEALGSTVTNMSQSSRGFVQKADGMNFVDVINRVQVNDYDLIIFFGGVNDYLQGVPLSVYYTPDENSFWGALQAIAARLDGFNGDVCFITPLVTTGKDKQLPNHTLDMYRQAIASFANARGYMLVNGSAVPSVLPHMSDGIHVNNEWSFLLTSYFSNVISRGGECFTNHFEIAEVKTGDIANVTNFNVETWTLNGMLYIHVLGQASGDFELLIDDIKIFSYTSGAMLVGDELKPFTIGAVNGFKVTGVENGGYFNIIACVYSNSLSVVQFS